MILLTNTTKPSLTKWIDNIGLQPMLLPAHCVKSLSLAASLPSQLTGLPQQITAPSMFKVPLFGSYVELVTKAGWSRLVYNTIEFQQWACT